MKSFLCNNPKVKKNVTRCLSVFLYLHGGTGNLKRIEEVTQSYPCVLNLNHMPETRCFKTDTIHGSSYFRKDCRYKFIVSSCSVQLHTKFFLYSNDRYLTLYTAESDVGWKADKSRCYLPFSSFIPNFLLYSNGGYPTLFRNSLEKWVVLS